MSSRTRTGTISRGSTAATGVFARIVCGIDESPAGLEAVLQAERLRPAGGRLHLVTAADRSLALHAGWLAPRVLDQIELGARDALARALEHAPGASSRLVAGEATHCLLEEIEHERATLVAVGSHGQKRLAGILLGGTATTLVHEAPCSVLLARPPRSPVSFPGAIAVGVDGSAPALSALEVAHELGQRLGVPVRPLAATGGKPLSLDELRRLEGLEWSEQQPVNALVEVSAGVDLLVLGSRGLHGFGALGSVSERVAHRARSSVLIVREPRW